MKTSSSESDFGDYLSNLRKKTAGKKTDFHIDGLSDFSLSELSDKKDNNIPINSKFLKNTPEKLQVSKTTKSTDDKPRKKKKEKKSKKVKNKEIAVNKKHNDFSDSEINFSLSVSLKENKTNKQQSDQVPKLQLNSSKKKIIDSDNDESSFGKDGNRFIKRKNPELAIPLQQETETIKNPDMSDEILSARDISSPRKSTLRSARSCNSKKKVTIMETRHQGSLSSLEFENSNSFEEINKSKSLSESENDQNFCGMNIMSFNDLVAEEPNEISIEEFIPENEYCAPYENIMSIEELEEEFDNKKPKFSVAKVVHDYNENSDSMSEIKTIPSATPRRPSNILTNQSISEVITIQHKDRSEIGSMHSKLYSADFDDSKIENSPQFSLLTLKINLMSLNHALKATGKVTVSLSVYKARQMTVEFLKIYLKLDMGDGGPTDNDIIYGIKTSQSITKKKALRSPSYSNDFTEDDTIQSTSKNLSVIKQAPKNKTKTYEPGSDYNKKSKSTQKNYIPPNIGIQTVEPIPIAHYVVSPEALECLSAYSPSMLLMTNMLRQQIELTKSFMETHERLYESLISSIHPTYKYSNLKETKEFIKLNKPKPLSMKEALRLVENED